MRRVLVWRHGETGHNAGGIYQGQLDSHLSPRGREQAAAAAQALATRGVSRLLSSDLARASDTADALAALTGLRVEHDERLREIHVGEWQGLSHTEVVARFPDVVAALDRGEDAVRGRTGERVADVQVRMRAVFDELVARLGPDDTAVVTTHGMASRALVADVVGLSYRQAWLSLVGLHNCHWAELVEHRTGWRLEAWNVGVTASVGSVTDR
ncbi:histidine phosphatase family protein [Ornithinimicrobium humiphilum]|uniref:Putative phosphoglycerate mutase n=1 Tax=Ornithinimicrobium humiphilum TaxID=125288 RepID=A0A543KQ21_9MICO|nr:histidine phosphatase family protein [Ornithinimicrobium humiphilum]TQM97170.1 putative phosphoglycerate mutase [Ornithinimicrobium humiphilum]